MGEDSGASTGWMSAPAIRLDDQLVKNFAHAVVRPGGKALLIAPSNRADGWVSIDDAVAAHTSFAVEVAEEVLALDIDRSELTKHAERLIAQLEGTGSTPIVIASGQPGHHHVFARLNDAALHRAVATAARAVRIDVRRTIRPPGAPHRLGLPVSFLRPVDPIDALRALEAKVIADAPRPLTERMARLLDLGDVDHRYRSRSEVIQALALGAQNCGWTLEQLLGALFQAPHGAGAKLREMSVAQARAYVQRCWTKAEAHARRQPAIADPDEVRIQLRDIAAAVEADQWLGTGAASAWAVLRAHLAIAERTGKLTYAADVRTLGDLAGVNAGTVSRAARRLRDAGWLRLLQGAGGGEATLWRLRLPKRAGTDCNTQTLVAAGTERAHAQAAPPASVPAAASTTEPAANAGRYSLQHSNLQAAAGTDCNTQTSPYGGCVESVALSTGADVWRWAGLGKSTLRVWEALDATSPVGTTALGERLRLSHRMTRRHLERLGRHGFARMTSEGWMKAEPDASMVARQLEVEGVGARQKTRHLRERKLFRRERAGESS
jgi:hypothetical protein